MIDANGMTLAEDRELHRKELAALITAYSCRMFRRRSHSAILAAMPSPLSDTTASQPPAEA
jgi:hypothetical protein